MKNYKKLLSSILALTSFSLSGTGKVACAKGTPKTKTSMSQSFVDSGSKEEWSVVEDKKDRGGEDYYNNVDRIVDIEWNEVAEEVLDELEVDRYKYQINRDLAEARIKVRSLMRENCFRIQKYKRKLGFVKGYRILENVEKLVNYRFCVRIIIANYLRAAEANLDQRKKLVESVSSVTDVINDTSLDSKEKKEMCNLFLNMMKNLAGANKENTSLVKLT